MGFLTKGRKIISDCNLLKMTIDYKGKNFKQKFTDISGQLENGKYEEFNLADMVGPLDEQYNVILEKIESSSQSLQSVLAAT